jgi:hypothetical protein
MNDSDDKEGQTEQKKRNSKHRHKCKKKSDRIYVHSLTDYTCDCASVGNFQ